MYSDSFQLLFQFSFRRVSIISNNVFQVKVKGKKILHLTYRCDSRLMGDWRRRDTYLPT